MNSDLSMSGEFHSSVELRSTRDGTSHPHLGFRTDPLTHARIQMADDDGHSIKPAPFPAEYVQRGMDLKQLKAFDLTRPCRISGIEVLFAGQPGKVDIHFWHDIDSTVHPYVPFRHFEWDVISPVSLSLNKSRIGKWIDLPIKPFTVENPQKLFIGMFAHQNGPRLGEDKANDHPTRSVLEVRDPKIPGEQPVLLFKADGDYMVRLTIEPLPVPKLRLFADVTRSMNLPRMDAGAIAWGDVNGDGWDDLLVSGRRLFLNLQGKGFREITGESGLQGGDFGLFADVDNDGDLDLWVGKRSKTESDRLYLNDGHGKFTLVTQDAPDDQLDSFAGSWLDFDGDGLVDLFVANGWDWQPGSPYEPDRLWKNLGGGRFRDVTVPMGMEREDGANARFSRAATSGDLDGDGLPELFVGSFRQMPDRLWTFKNSKANDLAPSLGLDGGPTLTGQAGFGHAIGANILDVDNDGRLDLFVANLMHPDWRGYSASNESWLYRQTSGSPLRFERVAASKVGIDYEETPTDPTFGDFDNDGHLDAFVNSLYHTANFFIGSPTGFKDETLRSGIAAKLATASAACDFDHDGRLDLAVADKKDGFKLYRNVGNVGNWLGVKLIGTHANRAAIGATVRVTDGSSTLTRVVTSGKGMGNSDSLTLHFGLSKFKAPFHLDVRWPGGTRQATQVAEANRIVTIRED